MFPTRSSSSFRSATKQTRRDTRDDAVYNDEKYEKVLLQQNKRIKNVFLLFLCFFASYVAFSFGYQRNGLFGGKSLWEVKTTSNVDSQASTSPKKPLSASASEGDRNDGSIAESSNEDDEKDFDDDHQSITITSEPEPNLELEIPPLSVQIDLSLRKKRVVTTYRMQEGKQVTNHKPLWQYLVRGKKFQFTIGAVPFASIVFVQDQKSAQSVALKNKRTILNNIGWGGQSCYGGTKSAQINCRTELATRDGCSYYSLKIQPPQFRLWLEDECSQFFNNECVAPGGSEKLWIQKPSGGQHGVGMSVHKGCDAQLKRKFGQCKSGNKKFFVMPYINPALLNGHKFDVRSYLLVGSLDPQLVFYHDGFVRRAANPYNSNIKDPKAHITNSHAQDGTDDHIWDFSRLEKFLHENNGFPKDYMTRHFRAHAMKVQNYVFQAARAKMFTRKGTFQIFALDWIIGSDGGIHMLEANSNPYVTNYKIPGFPETWETMMDLVIDIHTDPRNLDQFGSMITKPEEKRWKYQGWLLVFNELEEKARGETYNACADLEDNLNKALPLIIEVNDRNAEPSVQEVLSAMQVETSQESNSTQADT